MPISNDYNKFAHGGATYPLTSSTANTLLQDADPSLYYALSFFQSVLATYVQPRLLAEVARAPAMTNIAAAVQMSLPWDPVPFLTDAQIQFPLLGVYRRKEQYIWKTQAWMDDASQWGITYVLPPMTAGQMERIGPILRAVASTLLSRIENKADPAFLAGADVWAAAQLEEIKLVDAEYGSWAAPQANMVFPAWTATLLVKERDMPVAGQFQAYNGADNASDLAQPNGPQVSDIVDSAYTQADPTTISTLAAYWTTDTALVAASDGIHAASWTDRSSNAIAATPPATAPIILQRALKDASGAWKPALRFDRYGQTYLQATVSALANDGGKTITVLARLSDLGDRQTIASITKASDGAGTATLSIEANTVSTAGGVLGVFATASSFDAAPSPADPAWHVITLRVTSSVGTISSLVQFFVDGVAVPLTFKGGTNTWSTMAASALLTLGGNPNTLSTTSASLDIGAVVVCSSALSTADRTTAETFCRQYAGL